MWYRLEPVTLLPLIAQNNSVTLEEGMALKAKVDGGSSLEVPLD